MDQVLKRCICFGIAIYKSFLASKSQVLELALEILEKHYVAEWLLTTPKMMQVLQFLLWEQYREGFSNHCANASPCIFVELDQLMGVVKTALGDYYFVDVHLIAKVEAQDASVQEKV